MDKAVEQRIKEMKETAEKMQQLKKEVVQAEKKSVPQAEKKSVSQTTKKSVIQTGKKSAEVSERTSLAWSTEIKCDIPYYLL